MQIKVDSLKDGDKVLIVGGTGFIGRHLAEKCLRDTSYVTCLGLGGKAETVLFTDKVEFLHADIGNKSQLKAVLSSRRFNYVFNLAGYIDHTPYLKGGRRLIESHLTGLMNLIDYLDISSLKCFIQAGSSDEYGNAPSPQRETMRERPISPYSFAKAAASHFMQMLSDREGFPGVVLRFFLVYGPAQDNKRFLPQIINACLMNSDFKTSEGKQLRDFCFVDDVVEAMLMAALSPDARGHIINIASGVPVSIREVVKKVVTMTGGGKPLWGSYPYREGENMELYADISLAKSLIGWEPNVAFEDGLKKTIDYYRTLLRGGE
ncbi:MAG: NAD-dependent epimerase/dehydratase family protein [Thermodesulfovibrionales bacterium]